MFAVNCWTSERSLDCTGSWHCSFSGLWWRRANRAWTKSRARSVSAIAARRSSRTRCWPQISGTICKDEDSSEGATVPSSISQSLLTFDTRVILKSRFGNILSCGHIHLYWVTLAIGLVSMCCQNIWLFHKIGMILACKCHQMLASWCIWLNVLRSQTSSREDQLSPASWLLIFSTFASWSSIRPLADLMCLTLSCKDAAVAWNCFCMSLHVCSSRDSARARKDAELAFCCSALAMLTSETFSHCLGVSAKLKENSTTKQNL